MITRDVLPPEVAGRSRHGEDQRAIGRGQPDAAGRRQRAAQQFARGSAIGMPARPGPPIDVTRPDAANPSRSEMKNRRRPSGDHAGSESDVCPSLIEIYSPSRSLRSGALGTTTISRAASSCVVRHNATQRPFGESRPAYCRRFVGSELAMSGFTTPFDHITSPSFSFRDSNSAALRSGYVIDHIVPLACGGADVPSNMQWQTVAAAKAKDKVERSGCHR